MTTLEKQLADLARRYRVADLYVFGSRAEEIAARARGGVSVSAWPQSDVDIAVQPTRGRGLTAQERVRLAADLEDLFEVGRVDLVLLPEASTFLAVDVIRGELLFCGDRDAQAEDELYILRRAGDLASFQRERWTRLVEGGRS